MKPYVEAGINYTRFSSVDVLGGVASIDRNSWGPALRVGVDIPLTGNMYLNFDLKKVYIRTDVYAGGANLGTFKIDPVLLGLGWRFQVRGFLNLLPCGALAPQGFFHGEKPIANAHHPQPPKRVVCPGLLVKLASSPVKMGMKCYQKKNASD